MKCDIKKFFPSIDHDILIKNLKTLGFSDDEMWLIEKFVREQPNDINVGLALGNQSSQWFALFYLNSLDRLIKEKLRVKSYVRYMDDMILLHEDKKFLQECRKEIEKHCNNKLYIELNHKTQIGKVSNGIDFLGFKHTLTDSGKVIRKLRGSAKTRMKRHLRNLEKLEQKGMVDSQYIYIRKNAFYSHIKGSNESASFKEKVNPASIDKK